MGVLESVRNLDAGRHGGGSPVSRNLRMLDLLTPCVFSIASGFPQEDRADHGGRTYGEPDLNPVPSTIFSGSAKS